MQAVPTLFRKGIVKTWDIRVKAVQWEIVLYAQLHPVGRLWLDELVAETYAGEDFEKAADAEAGRTVLTF
ncbi:hypothetical protein [Streptomyces griseoaurantiacus]|uniref:hypothetical protein n=1 Tax=Streptomyces griseoaurantiacus TaxID=68213 RepID=UPI00379054B4